METKDIQLNNRKELYNLRDRFLENPNIDEHSKHTNLNLFMKIGPLAKLLYLEELYQHLEKVPGNIYEFGCYLGTNLAMFLNLRAIHEPFNNQRLIIGFDSFDGYMGLTEKETKIEMLKSYTTPKNHAQFLEEVLNYHQSSNAIPHLPAWKLIKGDVLETVPEYFKGNFGEVVALAYLDLATYKPTTTVLNNIRYRLVPGSVVVIDEVNYTEYPGASQAFREWAAIYGVKYSIHTSKYLKERTYCIINAIY